ncbi:XrtB/PEP-CTERM-associated polysaccharide biosynthesis outer membrane protein EpsL [Telluria beijingensis]|uniref:XrtB/PEP-CTERM-associated polysaccharide biosynthesis outer membrane protein EpsL n=1 Tax=Telluria beijingensis TaxID=3068633 RepID=UPI0027954718|nr:XrtB/PEP-CTERM-associated polysaccharide biosynthesis outer membrane protein EpsL [Massilia sp. REN29]
MPYHPASHRHSTLLALATLLCSFPALAAQKDAQQEGVRLLGAIGWTHDDNLLRVADDEPPFEGRRSDTYRTLEAGVVVNETIGRQRLAATARLSKVAFDHFDQLDYDGRDLQASWLWEVGSRFEGRAETLYIETLAPYTDFDSDERNLRQQRRQVVDASWKMHPSWKLRVGAARDKYTYELLAQRYNNRTEKAVEAELLYRPRSGSSVGLVARRIKGTYPYRRPSASGVLTDDFTQHELKARIDWLASGTTTVQALAGYARREQPSYGEGSTSGINGRITAIVKPAGKISYSAALWREFAPIESPSVSYTLNKGASLQATWLASDKIRVDASAAYEKRDYTARTVFAGSDDLTDAIRSASLRALWQVRSRVQVVAGYAYQARAGSPVLGTGKFDANMVQLSANLLF